MMWTYPKEFDVIVIGIIPTETHETKFNPGAAEIVLAGDILVVLGEHVNIQGLEKKI